MAVRGKFYVAKVELFPGQAGGAVTLNAVVRGARNASWSAATPSGEIRMHISNPSAHQWFMDMLQKRNAPEVYVDFTEAPNAEIGDGHPFVDNGLPEGDYRYGKCADCDLPEEGTLQDGRPYHP
jgi:hypothetical protein